MKNPTTELVMVSLVMCMCSSLGWSQEGRSIFSVLDTQGRVLTVGQERLGVLTEDDLLDGGGSRIQVWELSTMITQGEAIQLNLESDAFDALLYVVGPGLAEGLRDDDSGGGTNSRICFVPDGPGEYRFVVSTFGFDLGPFTISAISTDSSCANFDTSDSDPISFLASLPTNDRFIEVDQTMQGILTNSDELLEGLFPVQAWKVRGVEGQRMSVDLISEDFDSFLILIGADSNGGYLFDDDGAGRCDSRITFTPPTSAEYLLVVMSTEIEATGSFRLIATEDARPVSLEPCIPLLVDVGDPGRLEEVAIVGTLIADEAVTGRLRGDEQRYRGSPLQGWNLTGTAGERLNIELTSEQFDTYLVFDGPGFYEPLSDDDSAADMNSRICVQLPETGTYRIFAGSYASSVEPDVEYRLEASTRAIASCGEYRRSLNTLAEGAPTIGVDEEKHGGLTGEVVHPDSRRPIEAWILRAPLGTLIYVDVVSDVFDAYLYALSDEDGVLTADDYGDSTNSHMELNMPSSGEVILLVSSYAPDSRGDYRLRISQEPPTE